MEEESSMAEKPRVEIVYCPRCNWLLRSAWMAQELLNTFADDLSEVALVPSVESGIFVIRLKAQESYQVLWERVEDGGFPDAKVLKQRLRDQIDPNRSLGHSDR